MMDAHPEATPQDCASRTPIVSMVWLLILVVVVPRHWLHCYAEGIEEHT